MVHVTNAWTVRILTTVSNAKTHQMRPTLVTGLKISNKQSKPQLIMVPYNTFIGMAGRIFTHYRRVLREYHQCIRWYWNLRAHKI